MSEIKEYTKEIEDLFIQFLVSDPELFIRCKSITLPEYFNNETNKKVIRFLEEYSTEHSTMPMLDQIQAITGKKVELIPEITGNHLDWFLKTYEIFCRHKALEAAILSSPDLLQDGRYGEVEDSVKKAVQIGLVKDLGTDYFADPLKRLEAIRDNSGMVSTGWKSVDHRLYGGFNRGEITIFAGQSGAGKSLFLQNLAVNWATAGLTVIYITLELSEKLTAMRLDAMTTGYETKEVLKNMEDVAMRVRAYQHKHKGNLRLKQLPNGSTANDIRAYIKEYEIQTHQKVDAVLVDYLDLMMPLSKRVSPSDMFVKDKYVSEELRNLAVDLNVLMVSASQLNRGSYEEIEFDPSHIAGGISKVNTADNVVGIFTTMSMKEAGRYQIQFMKTRSSAGVGSKVDLAFSPKTLRITDLEEGEEGAVASQTKNIMANLKKKSVMTESKEPSVDVKTKDTGGQITAIRALLKKHD